MKLCKVTRLAEVVDNPNLPKFNGYYAKYDLENYNGSGIIKDKTSYGLDLIVPSNATVDEVYKGVSLPALQTNYSAFSINVSALKKKDFSISFAVANLGKIFAPGDESESVVLKKCLYSFGGADSMRLTNQYKTSNREYYAFPSFSRTSSFLSNETSYKGNATTLFYDAGVGYDGCVVTVDIERRNGKSIKIRMQKYSSVDVFKKYYQPHTYDLKSPAMMAIAYDSTVVSEENSGWTCWGSSDYPLSMNSVNYKPTDIVDSAFDSPLVLLGRQVNGDDGQYIAATLINCEIKKI